MPAPRSPHTDLSTLKPTPSPKQTTHHLLFCLATPANATDVPASPPLLPRVTVPEVYECSPGALAPLYTTLQAHSKDPATLAAALTALCNFAAVPTNAPALLPGVGPVCEALAPHCIAGGGGGVGGVVGGGVGGGVSTLPRLTLQYLLGLSVTSVSEGAVMAQLPLITATLQAHGQDPGVALVALRLLTSLSLFGHNKPSMVRLVPLARSMLHTHGASQRVATAALRFYSSVAALGANQAVLMGEVPVVRAAVLGHPASAEVVVAGLKVLFHLCRTPHNRRPLAAEMAWVRGVMQVGWLACLPVGLLTCWLVHMHMTNWPLSGLSLAPFSAPTGGF